MFALHYFFQSEESATKAIELAAANLKEGGHFFGVLPNGKEVQGACWNLVTKKMEPQYTKQFVLVPRWKGDAKPFGSGYNFTIKDTVTQVCTYKLTASFCFDIGRFPDTATLPLLPCFFVVV